MPDPCCVRADGGAFTEHFIRGGYLGIGWAELDGDLSHIRSRDGLTNQSLQERFHLRETKAAVASQVIAATIEAGLIKPDEKVGGSRKFARYGPFWA